MSLSYPFTFWVVAEQKVNDVGRLLYRWPSLTWRNSISTQDLVPDVAYFCAERGRWSPNQPEKTNALCVTVLSM